MSVTIHGEIPFPYQVQPDRNIVENTDGTLEGKVDFVTTLDYIMYLPELGQEHPDDLRLEIHTREIARTRMNLVRCTCHFRGIVDDPTEPTISYVGSPDRERIQTHPDFTKFAGSSSATALNGADWYKPDPQNAREVFRGFTDPDVTEFYGVEYYLKASTQITLTHWQTKVPRVERMKIVQPTDLSPFKSPPDVKNYLLVDTPYRQIGNLYQVSKIYLGSDKSGWSATIYPQT